MFLLQVIAGSVASFVVGMLWYHPLLFGRLWWRYQFPNSKEKFGECENQSMVPLYFTMLLIVIQSAILSLSINYLASLVQLTAPFDRYILSPSLISLALAGIIGCATLPHYLFGNRYIALFLVCYGHDVFQVMAGVFAISALI